jgi:hypothetical protein
MILQPNHATPCWGEGGREARVMLNQRCWCVDLCVEPVVSVQLSTHHPLRRPCIIYIGVTSPMLAFATSEGVAAVSRL